MLSQKKMDMWPISITKSYRDWYRETEKGSLLVGKKEAPPKIINMAEAMAMVHMNVNQSALRDKGII